MAGYNTAQRMSAADNGQALPGGRYPIKNRADLENAIRAVGRAMGGEPGRAKVRRFIIKRARAMNMSNLIPATWNADGSLKG
jgi:hypothetical protein